MRLEIVKRIARSTVVMRKIKCGNCGGVALSKTEKGTTGRAGADNVEVPAPNDTERNKKKENNVEGIKRTVLGCRW
jgi:hypothetical protein